MDQLIRQLSVMLVVWFGHLPVLMAGITENDLVIQPYAEYTLDTFENVSGGLDRDGAVMGLLDFGLEADLERLMKWKGATFVVSAIYGHGPDFSARTVGDFGVVSNIFHDGSFNIYNIYLQQSFAEGGCYFKVGQIAADDEFMVAESAEVFISSTFGPLNTQSGNMGAPIFPYAAPGMVWHLQLEETWFLTTGVFAGQLENGRANNLGFDWRMGGGAGAALFSEAGLLYDRGQSVIKLGGYYHTGEFENFATGEPVDGLGAVYAIIDHQIIEARDDGHGLNVFARGSLVASDDRAAATGYLDGGLALSGLLHEEAILGLGTSHTFFGEDYRGGNPGVSGTETVVELTYQYPVFKFFTLQPDIQYIINPHQGGGDALVLGLRAVISL